MLVAVSTIKDDVPNVEKFVRRNLGGGVDHLIVFLDGNQPDVEEFLSGSPFVTGVTTHNDWWHGQRQVELNDRQRTHATLAVRMLSGFSWAEWMFHVDGDEVVKVDRAVLSGLDANVPGVHLTPLEAVAELHARHDPTLFKPLLGPEQLQRLTDAGVIRKAHNRAFFRGHTAGKVGVRPAPDIRVAIHSAADADEATIPTHDDPAFTVLHYESPNGEQFIRKWRALLTSGATVDQDGGRKNLARKVMHLLETGASSDEFESELENLYLERVADDVESLRRLGVLQEQYPDSWTRAPEPIPAADLSAWEAAVDGMRQIPKSSLLPPARRGAPVEAE